MITNIIQDTRTSMSTATEVLSDVWVALFMFVLSFGCLHCSLDIWVVLWMFEFCLLDVWVVLWMFELFFACLSEQLRHACLSFPLDVWVVLWLSELSFGRLNYPFDVWVILLIFVIWISNIHPCSLYVHPINLYVCIFLNKCLMELISAFVSILFVSLLYADSW